MTKARKITILAVLTAAALCTFVLEAQLPPLVPIPGIKPGLSNVFTLFAFSVLGAPEALALQLLRIFLGCTITGQVSSMGYSLCGGLLSYLTLFALHRLFPRKQLWILSILCAIAHNLAQIVLAVWIMGTAVILWYLPALILSALITGAFTGLICQILLHRLQKFISYPKEEPKP